MCDHRPILVYENGGNYLVCSECSQMLGPWEQNSKPKYQRQELSVPENPPPKAVHYGIIEDT